MLLEEEGEKLLKATMMTEEDIANLSTSIKEIYKVGMKLPFTWEAIVDNPRNGHYEPVGIKWVQWIGWWFGKQLFRHWKFVERRLRKFRHFKGVGGYDWEDAEYRDFEQRKEWVQ